MVYFPLFVTKSREWGRLGTGTDDKPVGRQRKYSVEQIARLCSEGYTNRQIMEETGIAQSALSTIKEGLEERGLLVR
jgi:hypothetical protein